MQKKPAFKLGNIEFNSNLIQAPLAGISCSAMRRLPWKFGGIAYTCTEMLSAHQLAKELDRSPRYFHVDVDEGPVCFQLSGNKPDLLTAACEKAQEYGAAIIDFNVGCPKQKIRKKRQGSGLLAHSKDLQDILVAMRRASSCPVTVKIRVDNQQDNYNSAVLDAIVAADVDGLIVHGRNWRDDYETKVNHTEIKFFKDNCNIPVIANGDISSTADVKKALDITGADALMIARSAIGRPWIFHKIYSELVTACIVEKPTIQEQSKLFLEHLEKLINIEGEYLACLQARRLAKHYFKNYGGLNSSQIERCYQATCFSDYLNFI